MERAVRRIFWRNQNSVYMRGTQIEHRSVEDVTFYNPLMTSGTVMKTWRMSHNYQGSRIQPDLPLLKKGSSYQLSAHLTANPAGSVFLQVTFLDRYGEVVETQIEKSNQLVFTYPKEAYQYTISLLSAGVISMEFHYLELKEVSGEAF